MKIVEEYARQIGIFVEIFIENIRQNRGQDLVFLKSKYNRQFV